MGNLQFTIAYVGGGDGELIIAHVAVGLYPISMLSSSTVWSTINITHVHNHLNKQMRT